MTKNVAVVTGDPSRPLGATYPRRARGLVRSGRAEWLDEHTILLRTGGSAPSAEGTDEHAMSGEEPQSPEFPASEAGTQSAPAAAAQPVPTSPEEWMGLFRGLVDRVICDEVALR